jgi:hypothetical protein
MSTQIRPKGDRMYRICPGCLSSFASTAKRTTTCSTRCRGLARSSYRVDTGLKRAFLAAIEGRGGTVMQASLAAGLVNSTATAWLRGERARLHEPNLAKVAHWLGVEVDVARQLQGGTAGERFSAALKASPAQGDLVKKRQATGWYAKVTGKAAAVALRGRAQTPEHRARIGEALRAYHARPNRAHTPGAHLRTFRGRCQQVLKTLRRHHPELGPAEVMEGAIRRLLEPPYSVGSELSARAFLTRKKDLVRTPGRPALHERYGLIQHVRANWPHSSSGQPRPGLWSEIVRRVCEDESQTIPQDRSTLDGWIKTLKVFEKEYRRRFLRPAGGNGGG